MKPVRISHIFKTLYSQLIRLSWWTLLAVLIIHYAVSAKLIWRFETGEITEIVAFFYHYVTTVTTVGYGDLAPKTAEGRLVTALWIMPGGIILFTTSITKFVHFLSTRWRRRMRGEADYSYLTNHVVILGWQGLRTQRMVEEITYDVGSTQREIVLCSTKDIENPMPTAVKFVRSTALSERDLHVRAGTAHAATIIALGHDDNDTLAAALAAAAYNTEGHLVAHFQAQAFADLLTAHCRRAEAMVSCDTTLLVRAAQDPGSSRVHHDLLSIMTGNTLFSMRLSASASLTTYGELMTQFKQEHNATIVAVADDALGHGLSLNAPAPKHVGPNQVIYYIAQQRIVQADR
ncbi:MAG: ion channel [Casimicrobium sp.]